MDVTHHISIMNRVTTVLCAQITFSPLLKQKSNPIREPLTSDWSQITKNSLSSGMATIILMYADLTSRSSAKDRIPPAEGSGFMCMFMGPSTPKAVLWAKARCSTRRNLPYPLPHLSAHSSSWQREEGMSSYPHILWALIQAATDRWRVGKIKVCIERMTTVKPRAAHSF